jgi:hypothetical protein
VLDDPVTEAANCCVVETVVEDEVGVTEMATTAVAVPVPLRLMAFVAPVEELLVMVSVPVAAAAEVGSNFTLKVWLWPALNMSGNVAPDILKPVPVKTAELIVTASVPAEVKVRDCGVAAVLTCTLPNARLPELNVSVGTAAGAPAAALSCSWNHLVTPPPAACSTGDCAAATAEAVAVKTPVVEPACTVTLDGTVTAVPLLDKLTVSVEVAAELSSTVQTSVPAPVKLTVLQ